MTWIKTKTKLVLSSSEIELLFAPGTTKNKNHLFFEQISFLNIIEYVRGVRLCVDISYGIGSNFLISFFFLK